MNSANDVGGFLLRSANPVPDFSFKSASSFLLSSPAIPGGEL
jgi:hypothetical protein